MLGLILFIFLFLSLCVFTVIVITLVNIFSKSFQPKNVVALVLLVLLIFFVNFALAFSSLRVSINKLRDKINSGDLIILKKNSADKDLF
jgi:hypothetical protein